MKVAPLTRRPFIDLDGQEVNPDYLPGWLLNLLDSTDTGEIEYAARHCSDRLNIRVLDQRLRQLQEVAS